MIKVEDVGLGVTAPAAVKVNQACMIFTSSFSFKDIGSRKKSYADFFEFKNLREFFFYSSHRGGLYTYSAIPADSRYFLKTLFFEAENGFFAPIEGAEGFT